MGGEFDLILKEDLSNQQSGPKVERPALGRGEFLKLGCIQKEADKVI